MNDLHFLFTESNKRKLPLKFLLYGPGKLRRGLARSLSQRLPDIFKRISENPTHRGPGGPSSIIYTARPGGWPS